MRERVRFRILLLAASALVLTFLLGASAFAYTLPVSPGWNLVAGGSGSDFGGQILFSYNGTSYQSVQASQMQTGRGYWTKASAAGLATAATAPAPVPVRLAVGWSLIGNNNDAPVTLPDGLVGYVFIEGGYVSTTALEPGQAAWVKSQSARTLDLPEVELELTRFRGQLSAFLRKPEPCASFRTPPERGSQSLSAGDGGCTSPR